MLNISQPVIVNAALPIERLAEKLPLNKLDDLRNIHAAGEENNYPKQMKLLDGLRKEISGDISDPKTNSMLKDNFRSCIEAIDLLRAQGSMRITGLQNTPELKLATDKSAIPPEISKPLQSLRDLASSAGPEVSKETSLYMSRVEACSNMGQFGMIEKYSEQMLGKLRKFHNESDQPLPQLGVMAARVRDVTAASNDIDQKIKLGSDKAVNSTVVIENPTPRISLPERTSPPVFSSGSYLFSSLKPTLENPVSDKKRNSGLGL